MKEKTTLFKWYDWAVIILALVFIIYGPILFTQKWGIVKFGTAPQIGDTIGGITSPFVGLLGAYLVFIGFRAQLQANRAIQEQWSEDKARQDFDRMVSRLEFLVNNFESGPKKGYIALDSFMRTMGYNIDCLFKVTPVSQVYVQNFMSDANSLEIRYVTFILNHFIYIFDFIEASGKKASTFPIQWLETYFHDVITATSAYVLEIDLEQHDRLMNGSFYYHARTTYARAVARLYKLLDNNPEVLGA